MGENVTTRGVDLLGLPVGAKLRLGADAVVEITGLRNPCSQLDAFQPGLMAAVLGSGMAFLDGTVVNVALRAIGTDLGASFAELQWVTNGYLLSLASLILLGGSLGDRFGRRRVFVVGVVWFAAASALCGLAQNAEMLIAARVLQGIGGALLTPGSLAMIQGAFAGEDRAPRGPGLGDHRPARRPPWAPRAALR